MRTIASFEYWDVDYYIRINRRGVIIGLTICHHDVREDKWYSWNRPNTKQVGSTLKRMAYDHDEFEGLAETLRIDPEKTLNQTN